MKLVSGGTCVLVLQYGPMGLAHTNGWLSQTSIGSLLSTRTRNLRQGLRVTIILTQIQQKVSLLVSTVVFELTMVSLVRMLMANTLVNSCGASDSFQ